MANRSLSKSYEVIVKMKDMAPSSKGKLEVIELDLASLKSVEAFVKSFLAMKLPLHYLINNAGIAMADKY